MRRYIPCVRGVHAGIVATHTLHIGDKLKQVFLMALMTSFYARMALKIRTQTATL